MVSTRVGGVPEVLPPDLIRLVEPSAKGNIILHLIIYSSTEYSDNYCHQQATNWNLHRQTVGKVSQ